MDEATRRLEIERLLANADQLIERGKGQRGLEELWTAEALARSRPDEIRAVLDYTRAAEQRVKPRQKSHFGSLITALEHDAEMASRPTASGTDFAVAPITAGEVAKGIGIAFIWALGGGLAGAFVGALVGRATENPNEFMPGLDPLIGAVIGFPIGALVGLVVGGIWASSRRPTQPPQP
jgi:hypothetical protein